MTLDEAISKYKNRVEQYKGWENMKDIAEEHKQIAEWLEELKELRATSCGYSKEDIELNRNAMYNKAIDDFAETLIPRLTGAIYPKDVEGMRNLINDVAEQLKAGESE